MQVRDAGNLLTRANLAIPSVDTDEIVVNYRSMNELVQHLRYEVASQMSLAYRKVKAGVAVS